jgi:hypothetical protein
MRCEQLIDLLTKRGGQVVVEKSEGSSTTFCGRTVIIENETHRFKIGYLNLGEKQISVQQMVCRKGEENWVVLSTKFLDDLEKKEK